MNNTNTGTQNHVCLAHDYNQHVNMKEVAEQILIQDFKDNVDFEMTDSSVTKTYVRLIEYIRLRIQTNKGQGIDTKYLKDMGIDFEKSVNHLKKYSHMEWLQHLPSLLLLTNTTNCKLPKMQRFAKQKYPQRTKIDADAAAKLWEEKMQMENFFK